MLVFLQARSSSKRFPRKVLHELDGIPMIMFQINRILHTRSLSQLLIVTSNEESDDDLCKTLEKRSINFFRGSLTDVNLRFREALNFLNISQGYVMRLTADCPLVCPEILELGINKSAENSWDYLSNTVQRTFPDGLDFEIFNVESYLSQPHNQLSDYDREHVTSYFYNRRSEYLIGQFVTSVDFSDIRLTVDYHNDLEVIREIVSMGKNEGNYMSYSQILLLYNKVMNKRKSASELSLNSNFMYSVNQLL
jgi:spore coat polysaccharide biosynthesis protein SpsF